MSTQAVTAYHQRSKHHRHRYARGPEAMDWRNQPDPFRTFDGSATRRLPLMTADPPHPHLALYERGVPPAPVTIGSVAGMLELSLGLSAWKSVSGTRWCLRMNPSSGNLHPTEAYLLLPSVNVETEPQAGAPTGADKEAERLAAGLFHYCPLTHALERRSRLPADLGRRLPAHFGGPGFLLGLTSIFWRESWKYGERAFRYCQLDIGHALAAVAFAAGLWGWRMTVLDDLSDPQLAGLLGADRTTWHHREVEQPQVAVWIHSGVEPTPPKGLPEDWLAAMAEVPVSGTPNRLSRTPAAWPAIEEAAAASAKPATVQRPAPLDPAPLACPAPSPRTAAEIVRRRRSATDFDPEGRMSRSGFLAILDKTLPREGTAPFDMDFGPPRCHLLLFVHQVADLDPGLYLLCRNPRDQAPLRSVLRPSFEWEAVPAPIPLFRLESGDFRLKAMEVSCHQAIAGHSAFSLGMLCRFDPTLEQRPWQYRRLFWEAGLIGQVLYLEAEAQGVRGTGIGCFFDDAVHELAGIRDHRWQSLYHFTVGHPLEDPRLTTLPPYEHLALNTGSSRTPGGRRSGSLRCGAGDGRSPGSGPARRAADRGR